MSGQLFTKKRHQYSPTKLATALAMVKTGAMSKNKASKMYSIPRTTLTDKLSGRTAEGVVRPGPSTVITSAEEDVLVLYSILMASIGYPLTRNELLNEVNVIMILTAVRISFKNNEPVKDWLYVFKRRHPELRECQAMALGHQRAIVNKAMIDGLFAGLFDYLAKRNTRSRGSCRKWCSSRI
ncbi:uncharacterized protein LOC132747590 [Ruditapes philippinarum]|uniref:uncharacterized protein LOC132747590 n=1 Tax=Ruditapes philippinarum TaxID=129788 RepID=UPI00295AC851|nr:uncharacterized protein LOC132747590 [Ruditapes philippinarum]